MRQELESLVLSVCALESGIPGTHDEKQSQITGSQCCLSQRESGSLVCLRDQVAQLPCVGRRSTPVLQKTDIHVSLPTIKVRWPCQPVWVWSLVTRVFAVGISLPVCTCPGSDSGSAAALCGCGVWSRECTLRESDSQIPCAQAQIWAVEPEPPYVCMGFSLFRKQIPSVHVSRLKFRQWSQSRPVWAGGLVVLGGTSSSYGTAASLWEGGWDL